MKQKLAEKIKLKKPEDEMSKKLVN